MLDDDLLEPAVDGLAHQINLALAPETDSDMVLLAEMSDPPDFSSEDLRAELDRLKADQDRESGLVPSVEAGKRAHAPIPAAVPEVPLGMFVTPSIEQLRSYLVDDIHTRVGFLGMGGIGKTCTASWLVRHQSVRQQFSQILWVTLGQTPSPAHVQGLVLQQMTGAMLSGDESEEQRAQLLHHTMQNRKLLLVLDDCWDPEHEKWLNFVDEDSGAKVLLSSRNRQVIETGSSSAVVEIELPTEAEAVQMLLSTAGLSTSEDKAAAAAAAAEAVPPQAVELVQFCKLLPLSISIAGKVVKDLCLGLDAADWEGIVDMMKEESDDKRTVEQTVISASLNSIRGPLKESVLHLFKALAMMPEDAVVPLPIVAMLYESVAKPDGTHMKRPNMLSTRRLLKQLIDR
eukprot:COSAG02_NODE_5854_length_3987_cov_169.941872_3_plen_401_part_00